MTPTFNFSVKEKSIFMVMWVIFLGRVVIRTPKIVINHLWIYEKLLFEGKPCGFSSWQDPLLHTDRHTPCYFYIKINGQTAKILKTARGIVNKAV